MTGSRVSSKREARAGDLLGLQALDADGVAVNARGELVRLLEVSTKNPATLSAEQSAQVAEGFGALVNTLDAGQSLCFYVEATPVLVDELLQRDRAQSSATVAALRQTPGGNERAEAIGRLTAAHEQTITRHASREVARHVATYVVVPYATPARPGVRTPRRGVVARRAPGAHAEALRESRKLTERVRHELLAQDLAVRALTGVELFGLLWRRANPELADHGQRPSVPALPVLDAAATPEQASERARALGDALALTAIDASDHRHLRVGGDLEQVIYASGLPDATWLGWLLEAMEVPRPFTLSVHVRALDRVSERRRLRRKHLRVHGINLGRAEAQRPVDPDSRRQEDELDAAIAELRGGHGARPFEVSIYQSVRQRGPDPSLAGLGEAVETAARALAHATDVPVHAGLLRQLELWRSTLPLGIDCARRSQLYFTRHVADTLPLVGTSCGSPVGVPLGFAAPGGTVQFLDFWDPAHDNNALVVLGKSGAGKTLCTVALVAQLLARGAQGVVVDRADHYQFLCRLIPGARHLTLGAGDGEHAINPWDTPDPGRVPAEKVSFLLDLHALLLGDPHSGADDYGLTTHEHVVLEAAIRGVYDHARKAGMVARERELQVELRHRAGVERDRGASRLADAAEDLALRLGAFVGDGTYAHLTDRPTTVAGDAPLVVFDTRKVSERLAAAVIFLIGEHTAEGIDARAHARTHAGLPPDAIFGKSFLVLEEVWALIARAVTGRWVNDIARRSRHLGLALVAVTQQLDDFGDSRHGQALLRQASMQLHFKQSAEALEAIQAAGGLPTRSAA